VDLKLVMDEIATRLRTVPGLSGRTFAYPQAKVDGLAGIVSYPDRINYDQTYGRGMDVFAAVPVFVVVGRPTDRSARDRLAGFTAGIGASSVKVALEAAGATNWDDLQVKTCEIDVIKIGAVDYLAAMFSLDIAGRGTA
jgi:hypothetical protein